MPGPLNLDQMKQSFRATFSNIQATVKDKNGNTVVLSLDASQGCFLGVADAVAEGFYDIMKNQVQVDVQVVTPVPSTPGIFSGTGTGVIE